MVKLSFVLFRVHVYMCLLWGKNVISMKISVKAENGWGQSYGFPCIQCSTGWHIRGNCHQGIPLTHCGGLNRGPKKEVRQTKTQISTSHSLKSVSTIFCGKSEYWLIWRTMYPYWERGRGSFEIEEQKSMCPYGGRDRSNTGKLKNVQSHQKLEEAWNGSSSPRAFKGVWFCQHLNFGLLASRTASISVVFKSPRFC